MERFQTDGATLAYTVHGEGPLFVQLHGLTSCASREQHAGLDMGAGLQGFRVLRYDARGHGSSTGQPVPEDYRWPQLAEDLLRLLDHLAPGEAVHAAGPSMGAATLLWAALADPGRFDSLSLLVPPTAWESRTAQAGAYRKSAELVEEHGIGAFVRVGQSVLPPPALADRPRERVPAVSQELLPAIFRGAALTDLPDPAELAGIGIPARLFAWVDDHAHPLSTAERLHALIPGARMSIAETPEDLSAWPTRAEEFIVGQTAAER